MTFTRTKKLRGGRTFTATVSLVKLGNQDPYFSVQGEERLRSGRVVACGCMHEWILAVWSDLQDAVDLHLSTYTGLPMHAVANALYWAREGRAEPLRSHLRLHKAAYDSTQDLIALAQAYSKVTQASSLSEHLRELFAQQVLSQAPRWEQEAQAAIEKYGLEVNKTANCC